MQEKQLTQEDVYKMVGEVNAACIELDLDMQVKVSRSWLDSFLAWLRGE